ncbi:MAG: hypothetical protein Q8T09_08800 [Candidatus Melainabacteria bacterium]|nr:hypothetical protein [Candidatus Melainabacteria bacterium]
MKEVHHVFREDETQMLTTEIEFFIHTAANGDNKGAMVAVALDRSGYGRSFCVNSVKELNKILRSWDMPGEDLESYDDKRTSGFYIADKTSVDGVLKGYRP